MSNPTQLIIDLLKRDRRYKFDAYAFVYESLAYAHDVLKLPGGEQAGAGGKDIEKELEKEPPAAEAETGGSEQQTSSDRHLTGQQLCEAIRLFALDQYGLMAKNVLNNWGVTATSDFGEIVYNLIELGLMRKTEADRREDFNDVYDFETGLHRDFKITLPETK